MNHCVTRNFLFCVYRSSCPVLWTTVSQGIFCSVFREVLVLCYEPQCHKRFSVTCWQKSLSCVMNHCVSRDFLLRVDRSPCPVLWTTVPQGIFCSVFTEVLVLCYEPQCHKRFFVMCWQQSLSCVTNRSVTSDFLFCIDSSPCLLLRGTVWREVFCYVLTEVLSLYYETVSQEIFCYVLTAVLVFCYEARCHERFSVMFWQKFFPCITKHSVTRDFLFCVDSSPCPVLRTTVSQEIFCSVLTTVLVLYYEPQCHKRFSILCWQQSLSCVTNHSVTRDFLFCVDSSPCSVLWTTVSHFSSFYDQL